VGVVSRAYKRIVFAQLLEQLPAPELPTKRTAFKHANLIIVTSDPEIIYRMSRVRSPYTKSDWYRGIRLQPGHDNVFSTVDEKAHTQRRAQMAMGVSGLPHLQLNVPDK